MRGFELYTLYILTLKDPAVFFIHLRVFEGKCREKSIQFREKLGFQLKNVSLGVFIYHY